ncbi:MBL fold metallo-hydrolase [Streptomyces marincola]|uniref:MBL fold metallo-hydrolase n=1 Tax=Streptomyces marincola TaxID=2878388 RepID=A0A1W7D4V8_9ACTN|nr:MBL fold metallo-hydrolase [Streptomyces marincola]ARQ72118.1 MBL fold metallo-hydrolase [Streptomyces marincola]
MQLTKKGHACVRLTREGRTLVIDPGGFSEEDAAAGADAVLVTHEHPDHFDEGRLRAALDADPAVTVWTLPAVAERLAAAHPGRVRTVGHGDTFEAAGFEVEVHGELHAVIHPDLPRVGNVGFLVDGEVFHPGDAFTVPDRPVRTLMLPLHAPWNKFSEVLDYAREVGAERAYAVHDGLLAEAGLAVYGRNLGPQGPGTGRTAYARLAPGETVTV